MWTKKMQGEVQPIRVAVASYDSAWLRVVEKYFEEQDAVAAVEYYKRGKQLLTALENGWMPQVLVIDEQMQDVDLLSFMQEYHQLRLQEKPIVLGVCHKRYLGYTGNLFSLGLTDFIAKPVRLSAVMERVLQLHNERAGGRVKTFCEAQYQAWGLERMDSAIYLTDAIKIVTDTLEKLAIRKEIVWQVAELHGCSHQAVDSALRRLIDKFEKAQTAEYVLFKQEMGLGEDRPSVGALVSALKEKLLAETALQELQAAGDAAESSAEQKVKMNV